MFNRERFATAGNFDDRLRNIAIHKIAKWLGDGVEVVQNHYGHLMPKDEDIEKAFA